MDGESTADEAGIELARRIGENPRVLDAMSSYMNNTPKSIEGVIVQIADAISASRPGARRTGLDGYIKRLEGVEKIALEFEGVETAYAIQAGRELRIVVNNQKVNDFLKILNHQATLNEVTAERSFMKALMGGCQVPVGAYSAVNNNQITLTGFVSALNGKEYLKESIIGDISAAKELGTQLAQNLIDRGANEILQKIRNT